jgi:hypothetical protein
MNICFHFLHQQEIYQDVLNLLRFLCPVPESFADLNKTANFQYTSMELFDMKLHKN